MAKTRDYQVTIKLTNIKAQLSNISRTFLAELTSDELKDLLGIVQQAELDIHAELKRSINRR